MNVYPGKQGYSKIPSVAVVCGGETTGNTDTGGRSEGILLKDAYR